MIVIYLIKLIINLYLIMLFIRVVGSWFPSIAHSTFMRFIAYYTDPYLNIFRKIIPPIGGVLDLSPLLGFFVLQFLEVILIKCFT
jgi:YggT family protein